MIEGLQKIFSSPVGEPLLNLFFIWTTSILAFAAGYFLLYRRWPSFFAMSPDILRRRLADRRSSARSKLRTRRAFLRALGSVDKQLCMAEDKEAVEESNGTTFASRTFPLMDNEVFRILYHLPEGHESPPVSPPAYSEFSLLTSAGRVVEARMLSPSENVLANKSATLRALRELRDTVQQEIVRLEEVRRAPALSRPWNFVDFLYFSLITQSTVGYGDILPNSTMIRIVVSMQVLWGYFLLVVLLNLLLGS